jgi:protein gp37
MASTTKIEWTDRNWNPTTGCTKISPGCKNCYAEAMARRLQAMGKPGYENGFELSLMSDRLDEPLKINKPSTFFVNSMSDLFHEGIPFDYIDQVMLTIRRSNRKHTFQILTKRAERMAEYFRDRRVPDNAWLGVSVEDQEYGLPRMEHLRQIKASTRFISAEPLLEDLGDINLKGIHWVIVGGESGVRGRKMHPLWPLSLLLQCKKRNIPFFFKQWGTWGADGIKRDKKRNGRTLADQVWDEKPKINR